MAVITHHRVGAHTDGKDFGQLEDSGPDPVPTMGEIPSCLHIDPAQELTPHTARDDVIVRRGVQLNELTAGHQHGDLDQFGLENQPSGRATQAL